MMSPSAVVRLARCVSRMATVIVWNVIVLQIVNRVTAGNVDPSMKIISIVGTFRVVKTSTTTDGNSSVENQLLNSKFRDTWDVSIVCYIGIGLLPILVILLVSSNTSTGQTDHVHGVNVKVRVELVVESLVTNHPVKAIASRRNTINAPTSAW